MDSNPNTNDESQDEQQPGETVALNYIDKVHASLTKQWDGMSRSHDSNSRFDSNNSHLHRSSPPSRKILSIRLGI